MKLKNWLDRGDLQKVAFTDKTLNDLLRLVERDLKDCQIEVLSPDRQFATAYSVALNLSNFVIRKSGYRVSGKMGHHKITFDVVSAILGPTAAKFVDYFDLCRRKRNKIDYDFSNVVSETEVAELIEMVKKFKVLVLGEKK